MERWIAECLDVKVKGNKLSPRTRTDYIRQVRTLIPAKTRFPRSRFTESTIKTALGALTDVRTGKPATGSTQVRYLAAWRVFYEWAKKHDRAAIPVNPFGDQDWQPTNNDARSVAWDHATRVNVLAQMTGEAKVFMALILGSGMELSAAEAMKGADVSRDADEPIVTAHGTKNKHRKGRRITVDAWAWAIVREHARHVLPHASLWTIDLSDECREVRRQFYAAQVAAGVVPKPACDPRTGRKL